MKAVWIDGFGDYDVLQYGELPTPEPGAGEGDVGVIVYLQKIVEPGYQVVSLHVTFQFNGDG